MTANVAAVPLHFEGCSDDTFGEWGRTAFELNNCGTTSPMVIRVTDREGNGLYIWGWYNHPRQPRETPGCWVIGLQQLEEDKPIPAWPMRWRGGEYSPILEIDAPPVVIEEAK